MRALIGQKPIVYYTGKPIENWNSFSYFLKTIDYTFHRFTDIITPKSL